MMLRDWMLFQPGEMIYIIVPIILMLHCYNNDVELELIKISVLSLPITETLHVRITLSVFYRAKLQFKNITMHGEPV